MTEYLGQGAFVRLLEHIKSKNHQKIFIVTGHNSFTDSTAKKNIQALFLDEKVCFFSNFSPNAKLEDVLTGCSEFKNSGADAILAVGGGSVIDMAKIISIAFSNKVGLLKNLVGQHSMQSNPKLYCASTTSGSGSEATHFAVLYVDGKKRSIAHKSLLSESIAVDPLLSCSMSPYLTACSGFDALSQAIESYWATGATSKSRKYAKYAISLLFPNLLNAVQAPTLKIRDAMAEGSYFAGKAINISKTTGPHALSYYLTSQFSIPHGHAVALLLGHFFPVNEVNTAKELYSMLGETSAKGCCELWYEMMAGCFLETDLKYLDSPLNVTEMVATVNEERLLNNPVTLTHNDLIGIVNKLL